jgi:hypothetical protein
MEQTVARFKKYTMSRNSGYDPNQAALSPSLSPKHFPLAMLRTANDDNGDSVVYLGFPGYGRCAGEFNRNPLFGNLPKLNTTPLHC